MAGAEMVIVVAVMAPVVSVAPLARAHCPTTMAAAVAVTVVENVVVPVNVTATLEDFPVIGLASSTVTTDPLTAVTWPDAAPKDLPPKPPAGRDPVPLVPPP